MILYDQDFNFIGMSAETLTFLGYEDIDEFSSMHNDFADLFVKKEGYIHKFENFSWIHYVLFSGAANKKAFVQHKNGSELPVDITIKEVFLNHTYDGLRKVYSVKLINENFTHISKTDVHDSRSPKSSEFSLKKLTKDLDVPATQKSEPVSASLQGEESIDFTLDDTAATVPASQENTLIKSDTESKDSSASEEFILNIPPLLDAEASQQTQESVNHIDFGSSEAGTPTATLQDDDFKLDLMADQTDTPQNSFHTTSLQEDDNKKESQTQHVNTEESNIFSFNLVREESQEEEIVQAQTPHNPVDETQQHESSAAHFSFNIPDETAQDTTAEQSSPDRADTPEQEHQTPAFSFDLFKNPDQEAQESTQNSNETDTSLIRQIKSDIEEIDADMPVDAQERQDAAEKLQALLSRENKAQEESGEPVASDTPETESAPFEPSTLVQHEEPAALKPQFDPGERLDQPVQENSFEETLKEVFNLDKPSDTNRDDDKKLNHLNIDNHNDEHKQPVTKEAIKSDSQNSDSVQKEELVLPTLGNLGLNKEEELDFIEEFLDDTAATIDLMYEYLELEDYSNIKYSLIKISSSAEILHFDQMLEYTREMAAHCDQKEKEPITQKLDALKKITARYKEHYATIVA